MILRTESQLAAGGDAIARAPDGRVVFVEGAAPSEEVRVEITRDNPRFLRAAVVEVLTPSAERVPPRCRHFAVECGGCTLQHVTHASQVASKQAALLETLRRIGHLDTAHLRIDTPWSGSPYGYRTRARFSVRDGKAGYQRRRSHEVFAATECPILAPPLEALLLGGTRSAGDVSVATDGVRALEGAEVVEVASPFGPILVEPAVFGQANEAGNLAMLAHVDVLLSEEGRLASVLELYGGSGNFTRVLARHADRVTMVEATPRAVALARRILPEVELVEAAAEDAPDGPFDLVLSDPPRAGMSAPALSRAAGAAGRALIYVSCDPATFARDAARLAERSLALDAIRLFDLYPQTAHCEVIGRFRRPR